MLKKESVWMGVCRRTYVTASPNVTSVGKRVLEKSRDLLPSRAIADPRLLLSLDPRAV